MKRTLNCGRSEASCLRAGVRFGPRSKKHINNRKNIMVCFKTSLYTYNQSNSVAAEMNSFVFLGLSRTPPSQLIGTTNMQAFARSISGVSKSFSKPDRSTEKNTRVIPAGKLYPEVVQNISKDGFPIYRFKRPDRIIFDARPKLRKRVSRIATAPRELAMTKDLDWPSMWPTAKTFVPSAVPLPLRQSYESKPGKVPRGKYANTELMKIANFLHLTPIAISRHCKAIKKFCTKWPEGLDTDQEVREHFPATYVTEDYLHSSQNIRDIRARVVKLKVDINDLELDDRQRDKMIRLCGHRYDKDSQVITITTNQCPMRQQNQDYADYLLTALYFESKKYEKWEAEKPEWEDSKEENLEILEAYRLEMEKKLGLAEKTQPS